MTDTPEWGRFSVRQGGVTMATGSGPFEDIKREAAHYAAVYRQDGAVSVSVRRVKTPRHAAHLPQAARKEDKHG